MTPREVFLKTRQDGRARTIRCPMPDHEDHDPSCSVFVGDDGWVHGKCHSKSCDPEAIYRAAGVEDSERRPPGTGMSGSNGNLRARPGLGPIVRHYDYRNANGNVAFRVVGDAKKEFRQWQPDGRGGWIKHIKGVPRPLLLYRLPELMDSDPAQTVFLTEGEKDCDRLRSLGLVATCNAGGAEKLEHTDLEPLRGRNVVMLADNDDAGRRHVENGAPLIAEVAKSLKVIEFQELAEKGDVSDWLDNGGSREALLQRVELAPEWSPSGDAAGGLREITAAALFDSAKHQAKLAFLPFLGVSGYVVKAWCILLAAIPKAGKTTLLAQLVVTWARSGVGVLFITEESEAVWAQRLHAMGERPPVGLILVFGLGADPAALLARAASGSEEVVIVDTTRGCIGFEDENSNSEVARVINAWVAALRGKTLILAHHLRKSDGGEGRGVAGAGALVGAVDRILELRHDSADSHRRVLHVISRIEDAPDLLIGQEEKDGRKVLRALGAPADVSKKALKTQVIVALKLIDERPALTATIKESVAAKAERKIAERRVREALEDLLKEKRVTRHGEGKKGDPYTWDLPSESKAEGPDTKEEKDPEFVSGALTKGGAGNESGAPLARQDEDPGAPEFVSGAPPSLDAGNESESRTSASGPPDPDPAGEVVQL